ncbi:MAG TPA: 23S rRNA (uracil(1939)-C(5))-methyltransferase RlmD [Candidatus Faeciplasma gallinarum]|uniref:23S rRNA (Uracil(1939)-C(5))-methyltransferase RlmD n=1 Tax=Candidatus Faeciplasma gallinarum TaxID=2840799 RepID=A0A9D1ENF9_9FIRM|nr:23S rRNA (uracil(1939)-C(5))-methyltransferase RlmD [Candidatus Faeciplasma gallinarum]
MNKNDIVRLEITALTSEGNGVGRYEGMAVFVPYTAVGDVIECRIVKLKPNYAYGKIERLLFSSKDRIEPDCPSYFRCGGCVFRHISYDAELRAKEGFVRDSFRRIGGFELEPEPIIGCKDTYHYRNKVQLPVASDENGCFYGFFSQRSHRVIRIRNCLIQPEIFTDISDDIISYQNSHGLPAYDESTGRGLLRHIYLRKGEHSGEIMVVLVVSKSTDAYNELAHMLADKYKAIKTVCLNVNSERTNVILGSKDICLYGDGKISDIMCGMKLEISPHAFYQVNTPAAETVYSVAKDYAHLSEDETLLDLYCGIGTVGLSMADKIKKLVGVEVIEQAIVNARKNAELNGMASKAEFVCGDAGEISRAICKESEDSASKPSVHGINDKIDVVVVDPPRKGCDKTTLDAILDMSPERVVYISCNHATAARDAKYLCEQGYSLVRYRPCDMFPRTAHVETVVLLSKGEIDSKKVRVEFSLEGMDMSGFQKGTTYEQIKAYVLKHTGLKVSSLYISQVKRKCGLDVGQNYNLSKKENAKVPKCPPEKEAAIMEALKYFRMI